MQERVCFMCRVGAFWPLCLARALEQLRGPPPELPPPHTWELLGEPPPPNLPTQADREAHFWAHVDPYGIGAQFFHGWDSPDSDEEDPGPPPSAP